MFENTVLTSKTYQIDDKMELITKLFQNSVRTRWNSPALTDYKVGTETYGELARKIELLHILWKMAGLKPGDKVAINARSTSYWGEVFMGALSGGYVSVQLYNAFLPADVQKLVNHSDSKILYTEKKSFQGMNFDEMPEIVAAIDTDTNELLASRNGFEEIFNKLEEIFQAKHPDGFGPDDINYDHLKMEDVCAIMYTSGSTGNPKGVMLSVKNFSWNVMELKNLFPYREGENYVSILPYAHIFGLTCDLVCPMCFGMHSTILGKMPIPSLVEEVMKECRPRIFLAVPLVLAKFVEYTVGAEMNSEEGKAKLDNYQDYPEYCAALREKVLGSLGGKIEAFATGGAAIPPAIESLLAFKINLPFITGYGMTECAPLLALGKVGSYKAKSCGETVPSLEVRIDSADQEHIPGEFQVKGDCVFAGYYKNEEATKATFTEDGWFKTGDMGVLDKDSTLFLLGRCKNMLLSTNGQNIYPEEIEVVLNSLPYVAESVVIQKNSQIHALIVPNITMMENDNLDADSLKYIMDGNITKLNAKFPAYSAVNSYELRYEPFAKTPKGSIRRFMYF